MERKRLVDLIRKQRSGGLTREEEDELESYWVLAQNDQSRFDALTQAEKEALRLSMMANIKARIHADRGVRRSLSHSLNNRSLWLSLAACITIAVAAFIYWPDAGNPEMNIYRTAYGEQLRLRLPDQSNVIVNGNSSVKFTTQWQNEGDREVWVDGEVFFDVRHTSDHRRFIVHTEGGITVQVLGTKFNVKNRRGQTEVMLQEGKVRLEVVKPNLERSVTLEPGELATLTDSVFLKRRIEPRRYSSWTENKLFFTQTPLSEVASLLEDTYGMKVIFSDETLKGRKLSGEIAVDEAADILKAIEETMGVKVITRNSEIVFQ